MFHDDVSFIHLTFLKIPCRGKINEKITIFISTPSPPQETSENLWFSVIFRRCRKGKLAWNGFKILFEGCWHALCLLKLLAKLFMITNFNPFSTKFYFYPLKTRTVFFKACVGYFLSNFHFHWKLFFISSKKLFLFSKYSMTIPHFPDSKDKWKLNDLWCHELACINLQI